jgi:hypothetical protein
MSFSLFMGEYWLHANHKRHQFVSINAHGTFEKRHCALVLFAIKRGHLSAHFKTCKPSNPYHQILMQLFSSPEEIEAAMIRKWKHFKHYNWNLISCNIRLEQRTSSAHIFSKLKVWRGKHLKINCSYWQSKLLQICFKIFRVNSWSALQIKTTSVLLR